MSGREKPDAPGLWRDANEKTVVACMESGELAIRDADTGEILSAGQLEQAAPFQRTEWKGIDLTRAGFSAMLILSSIRQAKQDRYRSRSFPMRHHYALRAQKT